MLQQFVQLREMDELGEMIKHLPPDQAFKASQLWQRVDKYMRLQWKLIGIAQDTVDNLQVESHYLQFDLEATTRERDALVRQ
ncbi:MAG: hypothetical protein ACHQVK_02715, partial [Candidatus Paceibacterales bacterium]